ncbi:MAG: PQQ-dependent sugar dehydrogenase [Cyclobacteriaceae bacterium]|nr:PQQ-dependent sugar dehydrogenase [Cyclobacteriaceae bacterium]
MKSLFYLFHISILFFVLSCKQDNAVENQPDYSTLNESEKRLPVNAVAGLETHPELETVLFASEPMLMNPTNMDIDAKGRVWVTEGYNYRIQIHKNNPVKEAGDRIVILEDIDGDGKADTSKVFYQGTDINTALGIVVLGNRVIVSCSPLVMMLTDTDGDDVADEKEILLTGIEGVQHDHGVHAFVFGPDGNLYFNFGNSGTRLLDRDGNPIKDSKTGAIIDNSGNPYRQGMVFRANQDLSKIEVLAHNFRNNYEVAVDSYGTLWQSDNDDDGNKGVRINYVMEYGNYGYTDEMTGAGWRASRTGMHDSIPIRHWHQNDPGSIPNLLQTGSGSPTGMVFYEGNLLPEVFRNQMIHSEPGHNVVRSYPTEKNGAGYKASIVNIVKGNGDQWFRPSDVCVAPDGSIFVSDWYDPGVGGHAVGDLNRGRIFRIAPKNTQYNIVEPELNSAKAAVEALKSPNLATRYLAWTKLDQLGVDAEASLLELWNSANPVFQARALWLLTRLPGKGDQYLTQALAHENEDIRITGIRVARNLSKEMIPLLQKLVNDPSTQVKREVALALRNENSNEAEDLWVQLAMQYDGQDRWYLEALGIGAQYKSETLYQKWLTMVGEDWKEKAGRDIVWRLRDDEALPKLTELIATSQEPWEDKLRYLRAFDFHSEDSRNAELMKLIKTDSEDKDKIVITGLSHFSEEFISKNSEIKKLLNTSLKAYKGTPEYLELVRKFKLESEYDDVFRIALDSAVNQTGILACKLLIDLKQRDFIVSQMDESNTATIVGLMGQVGSWDALGMLRNLVESETSPQSLKVNAIKSLGGSRDGQRQIIWMIEGGKFPVEHDSLAIDIFMASGHEDLRKTAAGLLQSPEIAGGKTFQPIAQLMKMSGDAENGQKIYESRCLACHQLNNKGVDYGPGLSEIGNKLAKSALYKAVLDPAEAISFGYEGYDIKMKDGTEARGYITSNTENYIELKLIGGTSNRYNRADIESVELIEGSLMTSMAATMEEQELVDLITYLEGLK